MTNIFQTDLYMFILIHLLSSKSFYGLQIIYYPYNSSTPGFKAMKWQDHLHHTDFKNKLLQQKISFFLRKNVDVEEEANGNNVDSQEQIRQLTPNENMIDYCQITMQSLMECYEIVGGLKR